MQKGRYVKPRALSISILILALFHSLFCTKQDEVDRITEGGVEVVINHLEPYKIKDENSAFIIEEEFRIDTERDVIAQTGLTDISSFDIDSKGNIYLLNYRSNKDFVYKYNKKGKFVISFGRKGQGPGEISRSIHLEINSEEQIAVTDITRRKLILFNKNGKLIEEIPSKLNFMRVHPLKNKNNLVWHQDLASTSSDYPVQTALSICDDKLIKIRELDRFRLHKNRLAEGTEPLFSWSVTKDNIFIGHENRGYEILIFDLKGNLTKKIRKEYRQQKISDEYKQDKINRLPERIRKRLDFPDYFPPYQGIMTDEMNRLFVMTYEQDKNSRDYIFDIFNQDGIFIGRKALPILFENGTVMAKIKKKYLYCTSEKVNGFKMLIIYKIKNQN